LDRAKKAVKDCQLSMPYTGVIGRVEVEPEDIVSAGQSVMTVQGENGLEFEIGVPATDVASLKVGMEATLSVSALLDRTFRATISEISPEVANNTTYPVTLSLAKGAEGVADLRPGLDGEAALVLPNPLGAKMRVPAVSVFGAPGPPEESDTKALTYVWVVQATTEGKGQLEKRQVRTAMLADRAMLEIESGLSAGEKVVIRGVHRLEEGMTVLLED
jgi:RND family efflux transporter MFP subunit